MSLRDDLQAIDGVGEATADKIMAVVEEHSGGDVDTRELERIADLLERGSASVALGRVEALLDGGE